MSCVLRVSGKNFDARAYAQRSRLPIATVHVRGEPRLPRTRPSGERHKTSGVVIDVSSADFESLKRQIKQAIRFLAAHRSALRGLRRVVGVETITLDFGVADRPVAAQFDYFPPELITAAGSLGIGLEISRYHAISG
jgi:hypothetical protein